MCHADALAIRFLDTSDISLGTRKTKYRAPARSGNDFSAGGLGLAVRALASWIGLAGFTMGTGTFFTLLLAASALTCHLLASLVKREGINSALHMLAQNTTLGRGIRPVVLVEQLAEHPVSCQLDIITRSVQRKAEEVQCNDVLRYGRELSHLAHREADELAQHSRDVEYARSVSKIQ